jgi:lysophospholipase L1-like esterase
VSSLHRRLGGAVALSAVGALVLGGCGKAETAGSTSDYVALGDSYSSGPGIAPVSDPACNRSGANYAALVAKRLDYGSFTDVSCGGATTADLNREQIGTGNGPQLDAVGRRTRLVTLTIGLNDQKVSSALLFACLSGSDEPSAWCKQVLAVPDGAVDHGITEAAARVEKSLRAIRKRAPKALVILVGYPRVLPDAGDCPDRLPLVTAMEPRLRATLRAVNEAWRGAAARAGARYVDTWTMSQGHDVCSDDPWVNGTTQVPGRAAPLHPFPDFHQAVDDSIVELVKED